MELDEFLRKLHNALTEVLGIEYRLHIEKYYKNNIQPLTGLTILGNGENTACVIYLDYYFELWKNGHSICSIVKEVLQRYRAEHIEGQVDMTFFDDYSKIRNNVICKLIHYEQNRELLECVPHRRFLDMAIVFYYRMMHPVFGQGGILIRNDHLKRWNRTMEELEDDAISNTVRILPYEFTDMRDLLQQLTGQEIELPDEEGRQMYILTNTERYYGAAAMIYDSILAAIAEKLHTDFYLLPSSIHECMIIPSNIPVDVNDLQIMVSDINEEYVAKDEILSDSVYFYDRMNHKLMIAAEKQTCEMQ